MTVILGSSSPRRHELLASLIGEDNLTVLPPRDSNEASFDGLCTQDEISRQLLRIVQTKMDDVVSQVQHGPDGTLATVVCADTIVVAGPEHQPVVLGKPPVTNWPPVVREWFQTYYSGRTHEVWTGLLLQQGERRQRRIVKTIVHMPKLDPAMIDWYLSTNEPIGKAGGYGIQGQAAALVTGLEGSLTNVIGLPVLELAADLQAFGEIASTESGFGNSIDHPPEATDSIQPKNAEPQNDERK
jgi:septum formation protein